MADDVVFTNVYDVVGNRTSLAAAIDGTDDFLNTYTYDDLYRLTRVTQEEQSGGNSVSDKRVDFAYNALGLSFGALKPARHRRVRSSRW